MLWWGAATVLWLPALWPYLAGIFPHTFDAETHLLRIALLDYHLGHGTPFPRWLPELMLGNGAPVFNFYSPLTYYLAEAWHLAGLNFNAAFIACMGLLVLAGGWGMFAFARDVFAPNSEWPALVAATAYVYAPYLVINVFIRGSLAEVGAQAILPWVFWSLRRLIRDPHPDRYVALLASILGVLILTHNLIPLLAAPFLACYGIVLWWHAGRRPRLLGLTALACLIAAGATAFFWLPVVFERSFLSSGAYNTAAAFLARNVWRWPAFLNTGFRFGYSSALPVQLGLVQLAAALLGAVLARRRDAEWIFFVVAALAAGLAMGAWALPLWLSNPILLPTQFPWRLLCVMDLALAVLAGGIVLHLRPVTVQAGLASVCLAALIASGLPQTTWTETQARAFGDLSPATVARYEATTGNVGGAGYIGEFRPRWAKRTGQSAADRPTALAGLDIQSGSALGLRGTVSSLSGGPLYISQFYFPGWEATVDERRVPTYPAPGTGALAFDVPGGSHVWSISWRGTALQHAGALAGLLVLAACAAFAWLRGRRAYGAAAGALLVAGAAIMLWPAGWDGMQRPPSAARLGTLDLIGYRLERGRQDTLTVYPYWYVRGPAPDTRIRWELRDAGGGVTSARVQRPYYDTAVTSTWPVGMLAADALELGLPADMAGGRYQLYFRPEGEPGGPFQLAGPVDLAPPSGQTGPSRGAGAAIARFGDAVIDSVTMTANGKTPRGSTAGSEVPALPGDTLRFTLDWLAAQPLQKDYQARIELVDAAGIGVSGDEHTAGGPLNEPPTWDAYRPRQDTYQIMVPRSARPGLYTVQVRLFDPQRGEPIEAADGSGIATGDHATIGKVKVLAPDRAKPARSAQARLGDLGSLIGYDLEPAGAPVRAGGQLTVTLYYRAGRAAGRDYSRSLQLGNPELGLAAQHDSYPAEGRNPTSSWLPGELIVDPVVLTVKSDAGPGEYPLVLTFYDLAADLRRLQLSDSAGRRLPGDQLKLGTVLVGR